MKIIPFVLLLTLISFAAPTDLLYVPEILKPNISFWQDIYRNISRTEGLMHDSDSLRIVYDTLHIGNNRGRKRSRMVKHKEREIAKVLKFMAMNSREKWDSKMKFYESKWGRELSKKELLRASNKVRFQLGQKENFIAGIKRSGKHLKRIEKVFKKNKLPVELAYLPHVESSFNYKAYSKVGAAGMWQFMRSTGRQYMKVGYTIDERLDPIKATVSAMKLLRSNYKKLKSWPLALTAYNHGARSMQRAIKRTGSLDIGVIVSKYKNRRFGFASKNFYACFVAAHRTASNYEKYFGPLKLESEFTFTTIRLNKYYRPSSLAKALNIPLKTLKEYNLAIRKPVFNSDQYIPKKYNLKLPISFASKNLKSLIAAIPKDQTRAGLPMSAYHKVRRGENLSYIAARYGIRLGTLLRINNMGLRSRIHPGQMIILPGGKKKRKTTVVATRSKEKIVKGYIPSFLMATIIEEAKPVEFEDKFPLFNLSYLYEALLGINDEGIRDCDFCEFNADLYELDFITTNKNSVTIKVQINETMGHYAEWAQVAASIIRRANYVSSNIRLGQKLTIPVSGKSAEVFHNKRIEHHVGIEEDFFNNYDVVSMDTLTALRGTNIWNICRDNEIPLWLFMKANRLHDNLRIDQKDKLIVPVIEAKN